jgi:hypothetical protein
MLASLRLCFGRRGELTDTINEDEAWLLLLMRVIGGWEHLIAEARSSNLCEVYALLSVLVGDVQYARDSADEDDDCVGECRPIRILVYIGMNVSIYQDGIQ